MCAEISYSLEDLLAPDVLQPRIQILNFLSQGLNMRLVCAFNPACLSDSHVQRKLDRAVNAAAQPSPTLHVLRCDTNAMLS